ncbi:MAG: DUF975 family protein [Bacteroidales bacterium]|nr:DUF975 family protein [Bacteroidales bacterium]
MKTNTTFKEEALSALKGNWGKGVLLMLIYFLLAGVFMGPVVYTSIAMQEQLLELGGRNNINQMLSAMQDPDFLSLQTQANASSSGLTLLEILVLFPLSLGVLNAFRKLLTEGDNDLVPNAFHLGFKPYLHKVWGMLLMYILIVLWTLLFIIPGIIKTYSYAMTPYILHENPELSASEAIHRSRMMMKGHKFDLFWLQLSFIGWFFLCLLTTGIGFLWLQPYYYTAQAAFYEEVKSSYALEGGLD